MSKKNKDIMEQYSEMEDFGFSAAPDAVEVEKEAKSEVENLQSRLRDVEKKIMPLLSKLAKSADESDTIYWPNRKELLEDRMEEILKLTRGE